MAQHTPYGARPPKPRPRVVWFVVGGALLLAAVAVFGIGLYLTASRATTTDATFRTDEGEVRVESPAGERRMLFVPEGAPVPECTVSDGSTERPLDDPAGTTTVTTGGEEWEGLATFDSGDGALRISCTGGPTTVRVGEPLGASFVVGLLVTLLLPAVLGVAGLAVLVVTTILFATRAPRR